MGFHFSNEEKLILPAKNYLIQVDTMGTFCFAFAPTDSGISSMGNFQQQSIGVSFDSAKALIGVDQINADADSALAYYKYYSLSWKIYYNKE